MKKILQFDWVLEVRISDPLIFLFLFQPFYFIWMYKVGRLGEKQLGLKSNNLFMVLNAFLFFSMILIILLIELYSNNSLLITILRQNEDLFMGVFVGLILFGWIYCSWYSTVVTLRLDELRNKDYYPTFSDKAYRFFQFSYWMLGIWFLQPRINEYYNDEGKHP